MDLIIGLALALGVALSPGGSQALPAVPVDVVVYSTQTSGLAAVKELTEKAPSLRVALISSGDYLESPLTQGLSVEDAWRIGEVEGGFYKEWRRSLIEAYRANGVEPFNSRGRFVYEPEAAAKLLWDLIPRERILFYPAQLLAASDKGFDRYVDIVRQDGRPLRLVTKYFIDASVEADLARMLGAHYRVGRHEALYNDVYGIRPEFPGKGNDYVTAPQRFSALLTLQTYDGPAPGIADLAHPDYEPASYAAMEPLAAGHVSAFAKSWSMKKAVLPGSKRELNENWTDWPDVGLAFTWVFTPDLSQREAIRRRVIEWTINRVRYLQEHGYPHIGIATVPDTLYVREGPRVLGRDTYTAGDLRRQVARDTVALGCYQEYDRHDAFDPNHIDEQRVARLPLGALLAQSHPWLLVSTAVSTDYAAYSSAVRMEHMRAGMGGAAAALVVAAETLRASPDRVPYSVVEAELLEWGYRLKPTRPIED